MDMSARTGRSMNCLNFRRKFAWKHGTALAIPYMPLCSIFVPMTDQNNCGDAQADNGQSPVWCNIKVVWVRPGPGLEKDCLETGSNMHAAHSVMFVVVIFTLSLQTGWGGLGLWLQHWITG